VISASTLGGPLPSNILCFLNCTSGKERSVLLSLSDSELEPNDEPSDEDGFNG
jgi:hypothetical protein